MVFNKMTNMRTYLGDHPCHFKRYSTFPWKKE